MIQDGKGATFDRKYVLDNCHFQGVEKVNGLSISLYRDI